MTTPDPLTRAAKRLRDSVAALPTDLRHPWVARKTDVGVRTARGGMIVAAECDEDEPEDADVAAHIALTASPDVTEATVALLELLRALDRDADDLSEWDLREYVRDTLAGARALAAAIERQET